jgi:uncharacterized repeat protein (TIGR01451 family)
MAETKRSLKVFLCHAHSDKAEVKALYERLVKDGVDAWLDKEKLIPGQDWELEIRKAVRESDVVVVCLSQEFNKAGFRQKEVRLALDTAMEKPEGEIFIIPARLEVCENLESLNKWHWVDLFEDNGYDMLLRALRARADSIGATLRLRRSSTPKTSSPRVKTEKPIEVVQHAASPPDETPAKKTDIDARAKSTRVASKSARKPFKLKTEYMVAIIGAVATIIAAVVNSPLIGTWFTPAPTPTATVTVTTQVQASPTESSALISPTVTTAPNRILKLSKTANPTTYDHVGQQITYTYDVTNSGTESIGPAQFIVTDPGFSTPLNCGPADVTLIPNQVVSCFFSYAVTQADMDVGFITTNATVSAGGVEPSEPASTTVTKGLTSNLTPGSTIQHGVTVGESLLQIARCYGADFEEVLNVNPQISDPRNLSPGMIISVPRIGSAGKVYGRPCVTFHIIQSKDTWASIASKYRTDQALLMETNRNIPFTVGLVLIIPSNSGRALLLTPPPSSTLMTHEDDVSPNQEDPYGFTVLQGQVMYVKITTSKASVTLVVDNPEEKEFEKTDDFLVLGSPNAESGKYEISIFNKTSSAITYALEVSLSP